jgi:DNA-binding transcriptional MerR regulator
MADGEVAMAETESKGAEAEEPVEYSVDELAALTRVPSRTIRFYQSKGALHKPTIRGRKAVYDPSHVERLGLIGKLQERGLRIKAIRDLVQRIDAGELSVDEWLGLEDKLGAQWVVDRPKLMERAELDKLLGDRRAHAVADLVAMGFIERQGDRFLVGSPSLVTTVLDMESAGIDLDVAKSTVDMSRKALAKLAYAMSRQYVKRAGSGFGRSTSATDLSEAFDAARPVGQTLVNTIFGQEMERVLRELAESGELAGIANR